MRGNGFASDRHTPVGLLQTVDRALLVLLGYERSRPDWGVTEVAREFGWDTSVPHRTLGVTYGVALGTVEVPRIHGP
jgi:IclR family acetate operon transcriptional repressor